MAKTTNRVEWEFLLNQRELDRGLKKAQTGFKTTEQGSSTLQTAMGGLTKAAGVLGLAFGAREVLRWGQDAIKASSDYGEAVNAIEVSSGLASAEIIEFAKTADEAIGLSETAVLDAGVAFSGFADKIASEDRVAATFEEYITRATDFGSVVNLTTEDALAKFQSALAGESEPLRTFGIDISAANTKVFALQAGIIEVGDAMSEDDKVLARYGLLMQETADHAGDFANTSGEVAGQQKILNAKLENAQRLIGDELLPVYSDLLSISLDLVPALGLVADAAGAVVKEIGPLAEGIADAADSSESAGSRIAGAGKAVVSWGKTILRWSPGSFLWVRGLEAIKDEAAAVKVSQDKATTSTKDLADAERGAQSANDAYVDNMLNIAGATDDATEAQKTLQQVLKEGLDPVSAAIGSYQKFQRTLEKVDEDGERSAEEMLELAEAVLDVESQFASLSTEDINAAIGSLSSALGISRGKARDLLVELGLLDGKKVDITVRASFQSSAAMRAITGGGFQEFHTGGTVEGPEGSAQLAVVHAGEEVLTRQQQRAAGGGGGGVTNIFNINALDPQSAAEAVRDALEYSINTQGPIQVG